MAALKLILNELHYELLRKISEGGMGLVYEALQYGAGNFRKLVAIKLIREEYSSIQEFQKNFIGEARLVADLIHTNIVQTYHLGLVGGQHFMVMEFVNGVNLEQFLERHRQLGRPVPAARDDAACGEVRAQTVASWSATMPKLSPVAVTEENPAARNSAPRRSRPGKSPIVRPRYS